MKKELSSVLVEYSLENIDEDTNRNSKKMKSAKFYSESQSDDNEDAEDAYRVVEEGRNGRWNKLEIEIPVQKIVDFDSSNLGIDTEKGVEIAWNEMRFTSAPTKSHPNRFENLDTLRSIYEKLKHVLEFMLKLDHSNILKYFDYWFVESEESGEAKLVVITEYSTGGSLKKYLDNSRKRQTRVKPQASRRFLNQILYTIKFIHSENISIFHGHINAESIFIQNNGVIKLTPALLALNGVCEIVNNNNIRATQTTTTNKLNQILQLTSEVKMKDLVAIGKLAEEIFNIHLKAKSPMSPMLKSSLFNNNNNQQLNLNENNPKNPLDLYFEDESDSEDFILNFLTLNNEENLEKSFVKICLNAGRGSNESSNNTSETTTSNFNDIWFHPFVNNIYSLKVLSVYSLLSYFQEKKVADFKSNSDKASLKTRRKSIGSSSKEEMLNENNENKNRQIELNNETDNNKKLIHNNSLNDLSVCSRRRSSNYSTATNQAYNLISSNGSFLRVNSSGQFINKEKRKVSLTFLTNYNNLNIPQNFFSILEDIRNGLYPRLFKDTDNYSNPKNSRKRSSNFNLLKSSGNSNSDYLEFFKQRKQLIDCRSSSSSNLCFTPSNNDSVKNLTRLNSSNQNDLKFDQSYNQFDQLELSNNLLKFNENRRLVNVLCRLKIDLETRRVDLDLDLQFNDKLNRKLQCSFEKEFLDDFEIRNLNSEDFDINNLSSADEHPLEFKIENICIHLANELIDFGLINQEDRTDISETLLKTIKDYIANN